MHFGVTVSFHCDTNLIRVLVFKQKCVDFFVLDKFSIFVGFVEDFSHILNKRVV